MATVKAWQPILTTNYLMNTVVSLDNLKRMTDQVYECYR